MPPESLSQAVLQALGTPGSAQRFAEVAVDYVLSRPLKEFVDLSAIESVLAAGLSEQVLDRPIKRHLVGGLARFVEASKAAGEKLGDYVPDSQSAALSELVRTTRGPKLDWAMGGVDPTLIRKLYAPVIQGTLLQFIARLPLAGGAESSVRSEPRSRGFADRISKRVQQRAGQFVDAGAKVMGGLGLDVEQKLQSVARDFSESAGSIVREAVVERLRSEEGRALAERLRGEIHAHVLKAPMHVVVEDLDRLPLSTVFEMVPAFVEHIAKRKSVQKLLLAELSLLLEEDGERTLRQFVEEAGSYDEVRQLLVGRVETLSSGLFGAPEFATWLGDTVG